jgi:hypothetical protein
MPQNIVVFVEHNPDGFLFHRRTEILALVQDLKRGRLTSLSFEIKCPAVNADADYCKSGVAKEGQIVTMCLHVCGARQSGQTQCEKFVSHRNNTAARNTAIQKLPYLILATYIFVR